MKKCWENLSKITVIVMPPLKHFINDVYSKKQKLKSQEYACLHVLSHFSHVQLFMTLWTLALQAPLSMGFSGQEYWSGLICPSPEVFLTQGMNPGLHIASRLFTVWTTREAVAANNWLVYIMHSCQKRKETVNTNKFVLSDDYLYFFQKTTDVPP